MKLALIAILALCVGFDHGKHDSVVGVACERCHLAKHRPDHAACFGECHGPKPKAGDKFAQPVCLACHVTTKAVVYAPTADFTIAAAHGKHHDVACAQCHFTKPATPHARCAGCHDGRTTIAMTACASCHVAGPRATPPLPVTFSHAAHAARDKREPCTTCHIATSDGALPRPTTAICASCHDGKRAFAVTEACTKCHRDAPTVKVTFTRPATRFAHGKHPIASCETCHKLVGNEVTSVGHAPCATAGCHADDFGKPEPMTCGACHNGTEPWRHLVVDRLPADATEFGATLDHAQHPAACASCHRLRTASQALRPPRGHTACTTAGCHAVKGGPEPQLASCTACHALDRFATRLAARTAAPWSARASFDHVVHARNADGSELACTVCHRDLAGDAATLATPPKAACAPCHDGSTAFKLTGTNCGRCHRPRL